MKALLATSLGPAENLSFAETASPQPDADEVQIAVEAVALNFLDTLIIQGRYQVRPDLPFTPGAELSGKITAVGSKISDFKVGDRVAAYPGTGALAQFATAKAHQVVAVADDIDAATAAALPIAYGTTVHALKDRAALQPGETVLVLGAAGGVGLAAVQCARAMGARVIAAASTEEKVKLALDHGADAGINTSEENLRGRLAEVTPSGQVDIVYDPVGGELAEPAFRSTAWAGRYLVIGFASGDIPRLPFNLPLVKGSAIIGVYWGAFAARNPVANRENLDLVTGWVRSGEIKPHMGAVYDFEDARQAISDLANRKALGKIIVRM